MLSGSQIRPKYQSINSTLKEANIYKSMSRELAEMRIGSLHGSSNTGIIIGTIAPK